jgi:hypothetical protein
MSFWVKKKYCFSDHTIYRILDLANDMSSFFLENGWGGQRVVHPTILKKN